MSPGVLGAACWGRCTAKGFHEEVGDEVGSQMGGNGSKRVRVQVGIGMSTSEKVGKDRPP